MLPNCEWERNVAFSFIRRINSPWMKISLASELKSLGAIGGKADALSLINSDCCPLKHVTYISSLHEVLHKSGRRLLSDAAETFPLAVGTAAAKL